MIERRLLRQLNRLGDRQRQRRLLGSWIAIWVCTAGVAACLLVGYYREGWYYDYAAWALGLTALVIAGMAAWFKIREANDYRSLALRIERQFPELDSSLLAAIDQQVQPSTGHYSFLQERLIQQVLGHAYRNSWSSSIPRWHLALAHVANFAAVMGLVGMLYYLNSRPPILPDVAAVEAPEEQISASEFRYEVEPGNTEVERGQSLLVTARFTGPMPREATLVYEDSEGEQGRVSMELSLDSLFGGRILSVEENTRYRVEFAEAASENFQVTVFEYPRLERADAQLTFPNYTSLEDRLVQDVMTVSAVEGTTLTWKCYLNKPVAEARFDNRSGEKLALTASAEDPLRYEVSWVLKESAKLELVLVDAEGRQNKNPPLFKVNVLKNNPPKLKLAKPARDMQVSPLEELLLEANAWDDFGVSRFGVQFGIAGEDEQEVVLAENVAGKQRHSVEHLIAFEELKAEPDQLLSYHFWAEDQAVDGTVRRVASDMFFAEVRHFEEIFRQGQPQPGGQQQQQQQQMQGNAGQAQELAELQKQIINATWKIVRREVSSTLSESFAEDVGLLIDSQTTAMQQAEQLNERIQDSESKQHLLTVRKQMLEAVTNLSKAHDGSTEPLNPALKAEQAAYQALLKLRAREFEVNRSSQSSSQQSSSSRQQNRSQQQLQQLELNNEQNRYESESQAQEQQNDENRETRQVLNRLRELARRQHDLNERVKELQAALQEAETKEEEEELKRQLKRLREEQQQILRDTDELAERMDQQENQERMNEEREQLEQTRENVQRASEALEQGRTSSAVSAGTRAEREFEELRDEFRRRASGQFNEDMRKMREEAQQLDERQQEVAKELEDMNQPDQSGSLREDDNREDLEQKLTQQRESVNLLLDQVRKTIEEAETAEPLLADQLYDTARTAMRNQLDRALESTERSLSRGLMNDARQLEERAREGISELREGVERAAESVLGDETEALRRANEELKRLTGDLQGEIEREDPNQAERSGDAGEPGERREGENEREAEKSREGEPGSRSSDEDSEQREGQGQPSEQEREGQGRGQQSESDQPQGEGQPREQQQGQQQQGQQQQGQQQQQGGGGRSSQNEQNSENQSRPGQEDPEGQRQPGDLRDGNNRRGARERGGLRTLIDDGGVERGPAEMLEEIQRAPLTGNDFLDWSDRLRDVEEMVEDPALRAEAARIRDRARAIRGEVRRHSRPPNWDLVRLEILDPLVELRDRVVEELLKRNEDNNLVPIDRDPVPPQYTERVKRYYERLGRGK